MEGGKRPSCRRVPTGSSPNCCRPNCCRLRCCCSIDARLHGLVVASDCRHTDIRLSCLPPSRLPWLVEPCLPRRLSKTRLVPDTGCSQPKLQAATLLPQLSASVDARFGIWPARWAGVPGWHLPALARPSREPDEETAAVWLRPLLTLPPLVHRHVTRNCQLAGKCCRPTMLPSPHHCRTALKLAAWAKRAA